MFDSLVKSQLFLLVVIPAKAGIQIIQKIMDSGFRRSDEFSDFLGLRYVYALTNEIFNDINKILSILK